MLITNTNIYYITDKYRFIDIIMPNKFHFGRRVGSKGSIQKIKSASSDTAEARYERAIIREEKEIIYQERMDQYATMYEHDQMMLDNNRNRKASLRSKQEEQSIASKETATVIIPLSIVDLSSS